MMKKIISVLLCLLLIFGTSAFAFAANVQAEDLTEYPVILVPGYSSGRLYYKDEAGNPVKNEDGTNKLAWNGIEFDKILSGILKDIVSLGLSVGLLATGDAKPIADHVGKSLVETFEGMRTDRNCVSKYSLGVQTIDDSTDIAETCKASNMTYDKITEAEKVLFFAGVGNTNGENGIYVQSGLKDPKFNVDFEQMPGLCVKGGLENSFVYTTDFRMGAEWSADRLHTFVNAVLKSTGAKKANIVAISHGGQISATYLSKYCTKGGEDEGKIAHAVLTVPAIGGAGFAYDALRGKIHLDADAIAKFVEYGFMTESEYHWLLQAQLLGFLDDIIAGLVPYIHDLMGYWGSMWDFVPEEYYDELKESFFATDEAKAESAQLIATTDRFHQVFMPNWRTNFESCREAGTDIYIIAGTNNRIVTGLNDDSDAIINTNDSTGAKCAPFGKRFADGYVQQENHGFYQVSPSMTIDASTSYIPDRTWFIEGMYHGMTFKDMQVVELMRQLLFTNNIKDVNTDARYPQFKTTECRTKGVYAAFDKSKDGYLTGDDTSLVLTNLSTDKKMKILSIKVEGADIKFFGFATNVLQPGESVSLKIQGDVPKVSLKNIDIIVSFTFFDIKDLTPLGERRFNFTVLNGDPIKLDDNDKLVDASEENGLGSIIAPGSKEDEVITKYGAKPFLQMLYNLLIQFATALKKFVNFFKNL